MLALEVHRFVNFLYSLCVGHRVICELKLLPSADALCAPVEIAQIDRTAHGRCNFMIACFPSSDLFAGALRSQSQMHLLSLVHFVYHTQHNLGTIASVHRHSSELAQH